MIDVAANGILISGTAPAWKLGSGPRRRARQGLATMLACGLATIAPAQDLPTDTQMQAAFGAFYNHLGLLEYCRAKGFATAEDVANMQGVMKSQSQGITVTAAARAKEAVGRGGVIVGPQVIGLLDASNPARPEKVPDGRMMTLADNARAQKTTEQTLCRQMAAQVAPVN